MGSRGGPSKTQVILGSVAATVVCLGLYRAVFIKDEAAEAREMIRLHDQQMAAMQSFISQDHKPLDKTSATTLVERHTVPSEWFSQCDPDSDKQWKKLIKFFEAGGGKTPCKSQNFPVVQHEEDWLNPNANYRGMQATRDVKKGEATCSSPATMIFSLARMPKDSMIYKVSESFPTELEVNNFERQQLWLLHEMANKKSVWRDYLCHMPRTVPLPLFWTDDQVKKAENDGENQQCYVIRFSNNERITLPTSLIHVTGEILAESTLDLHPGRRITASILGEDTPYQGWIISNATCSNSLRGLADVVQKRRIRLLSRFNKLKPWLQLKYPGFLDGVLTASTWAWAYAVVVSRQWSLNDIPAMIPVCDMFNHKYGTRVINQTIANRHTGGVARLIADRDYAAGEEVFISYSDIACSRKWLHYYGFIPPSNEAVPCKLKNK